MALWPITSTTTSSPTPTTYANGTQRAMKRGSNWAITNMAARPKPKELACLASNSRFLPLAEYSTNRLTAARTSNSNSRMPSICRRCSGLARRRSASWLDRVRSNSLNTANHLGGLRRGKLRLEATVFTQQPGIHHLARHRTGHPRARLAVLDHSRHGDLWGVSRRVGDKQCVVTMPCMLLFSVI